MKCLLFLFTLLFTQSSYGQTSPLLSNVVEISVDELKDKMGKSTNDFNLIYSYASWCKSCEKGVDSVISFQKAHNLGLYMIVPDNIGSFFLNKTLTSLYQSHGYTDRIYKSDATYVKRYFKSYQKFMSELIPEKKKFGLSVLALFNKKGELLYDGNWETTITEDLHQVKEVIREYSSINTNSTISIQ